MRPQTSPVAPASSAVALATQEPIAPQFWDKIKTDAFRIPHPKGETMEFRQRELVSVGLKRATLKSVSGAFPNATVTICLADGKTHNLDLHDGQLESAKQVPWDDLTSQILTGTVLAVYWLMVREVGIPRGFLRYPRPNGVTFQKRPSSPHLLALPDGKKSGQHAAGRCLQFFGSARRLPDGYTVRVPQQHGSDEHHQFVIIASHELLALANY